MSTANTSKPKVDSFIKPPVIKIGELDSKEKKADEKPASLFAPTESTSLFAAPKDTTTKPASLFEQPASTQDKDKSAATDDKKTVSLFAQPDSSKAEEPKSLFAAP